MNKHTDISREDFDAVKRYLSGKMEVAELVDFHNRLSGDERFRTEVNKLQTLLTDVQASPLTGKPDDFQNIPVSKKITRQSATKITGKQKWMLAAAVMILIAAGAWLWLGRTGKERKLFSEYYKPDPGLISAMGVSDNYVFDRAMVDYKTGNYKAALQGWTTLLSKNPDNDTLHYFTGSAYLASQKADSAITCFRKIMAAPGSIFLKDAYWYCGLALLKESKKAEAIPFIEQGVNARKEELLAELKK